MLNILFVYKGYGENAGNSVVDFQISAFDETEINIYTFPIAGKGLFAYIKSVKKLREKLIENRIDVVHAHYSYSGFLAGAVSKRPVVCSLMGSDVLQSGPVSKLFLWFFYSFVWAKTIVKSGEMHEKFPKAELIPNGVDFEVFGPMKRTDALSLAKFSSSEKNIIFVAQDPHSRVKNIQLATAGIKLTNDPKVKFHIVSQKTLEELPYYYNAADMLLLTSLSEGSPNVIKEAMACNCPIVSTNVGDIREVTKNTKGCYISSFEPEDLAVKIHLGIGFGKRTDGRIHIAHLDSKVIRSKLVDLYHELI